VRAGDGLGRLGFHEPGSSTQRGPFVVYWGLIQRDNGPMNGSPARTNDADISPRVEEFLKAVESKTSDPCHRRLLRSCRGKNPTAAMEAELNQVVKELLDEA